METLRLTFFGISRERQEVTWPGHCHQVCALRYTFVPLDHAPELSDLQQGFLHFKTSQSHVWEEVRFFWTFLLIYYRILFKRERNFEDNFSAKIEVSGWMNTNMAAASNHPPILSSKYGQTGNVKPLTANHSLSFAVKWPNLDMRLVHACALLAIEKISSSS